MTQQQLINIHTQKKKQINRQTSPPSGLNGDTIYPLDQQPLASGGIDKTTGQQSKTTLKKTIITATVTELTTV